MNINKKIYHQILFSTLLLAMSCLQENKGSSTRKTSSGSFQNSPAGLSSGHGRILQDNPIILSGRTNLPADVDLGLYLKGNQTFITDNTSLKEKCGSDDQYSGVSECYKVFENANTTSSPIAPVAGNKWAFPPNSKEFLQVHTFGHLKIGIDKFQNSLEARYNYAFELPSSIFENPLNSTFNYKTSIPSQLYTHRGYWYDDRPLLSFSHCEKLANAYFDPSLFNLCFGIDPKYTGLHFAQDPTIIYHELAHALVKVSMNIRNTVATNSGQINAPIMRSDLGVLGYDEAGAINEGLADYYSYVINSRAHIGEWALARFYNLSRPMRESDPIHAGGLAENNDSRLSYPNYLNYNTTDPSLSIEDIHFAGQITSHYLVALSEDLKTFCSLPHQEATQFVLGTLIETMAELGDLTSTGSDLNSTGSTNLDEENAKDWAEKVNPSNYRRFFQTFSRYLSYYLVDSNFCPDYTKDRIEQLLDSYGLLLFKNYNDSTTNRIVEGTNRIHSILLSKDKITINPAENASQGYIIDKRQSVFDILSGAIAAGLVTETSQLIPNNLPSNNGNAKVSPGEVVGLALNLYNQANSIMGGIQVLGNDWDHVKYDQTDGVLKPCPINSSGQIHLSDFDIQYASNSLFPTIAQGAAPLDSDRNNPVPGDCHYVTRTNGGEQATAAAGQIAIGDEIETMAPVCLMQIGDDNETKWVTQDEFRSFHKITTSQCLYSDRQDNCFVSAIKGLDHAFYSKIDPNSSWGESIVDENDTPTLNPSNLIFFEVSPFIPPGTSVTCRFRVRFTNCEDCFHDANLTNGGDYPDYEYSGGRPFKVLNLNFVVID